MNLSWSSIIITAASAYLSYSLLNNRKDISKYLANIEIEKITAPYIESAGSKKSFEELSYQLEESGNRLSERLAKTEDTEHNRRVLSHIIAIERWSYSRLQSAIALKPWVLDKSSNYRPDSSKVFEELVAMFNHQRKKTIELASGLKEDSLPLDEKITHNTLGDLSVKAWFYYLIKHSELESIKIY